MSNQIELMGYVLLGFITVGGVVGLTFVVYLAILLCCSECDL